MYLHNENQAAAKGIQNLELELEKI